MASLLQYNQVVLAGRTVAACGHGKSRYILARGGSSRNDSNPLLPMWSTAREIADGDLVIIWLVRILVSPPVRSQLM